MHGRAPFPKAHCDKERNLRCADSTSLRITATRGVKPREGVHNEYVAIQKETLDLP